MIRVVLADDQEMVRAGLRMILESEDDIRVVGEAGDGKEAVRLAAQEMPDVVLMDVQMPGMDGLEATGVIREEGGKARVLILTTFELDDYLFSALRRGASGFMLKNAPPEELIDAVRTVAAGDALLASSVTRRLIEEFSRLSPVVPHPQLGRLTGRELEVLALVARGRSNREIAQEIFVGEATVKSHVSSILSKLGLRDRVQAVVFAYEAGVVRPGSS